MVPFHQLQQPLILCVFFIIIAWGLRHVYLRALPRPIPGIPHNPTARTKLFGDLPDMQRSGRQGMTPTTWFANLSQKYNSPLVQIFIAPFFRPVLILSDFQETYDIITKKDRHFDRSRTTREAFAGIMPNHHMSMLKSDPRYKGNLQLANGVMAPGFLNTVAAPAVYENIGKLVRLWKLKAHISNGRPFDAKRDVIISSFESIKNVAVGLGNKPTMIDSYNASLQDSLLPSHASGDSTDAATATLEDSPFPFPQCESSHEFDCIHAAEGHIAASIATLSPRTYWRLYNLTPGMREVHRVKNEGFSAYISEAATRLETSGEAKVTSAVDYMLRREKSVAQKDGREARLDSLQIRDELYGLVSAGFSTVAATFSWTLKRLSTYQEVQIQLRESLCAAHSAAVDGLRQPSIAEIVNTQVHYLDAVIEEVLRLSPPFCLTSRQAIADTTILGQHVPKGTLIFINLEGPSFTSPKIQGKELRDVEAGRVRPYWDDSDIKSFIPERWMKTGESGSEPVFDNQAGPYLSFGGGARACYGKRVAYLQLKIMITLIVWNFRLKAVQGSLDTDKSVEHLSKEPLEHFVRLEEIVLNSQV
ncbi:cytochrome P450 [Thozetella sp. PMI_491]|nr:cytochrome P450 [Thozetella sp. PMI_491]